MTQTRQQLQVQDRRNHVTRSRLLHGLDVPQQPFVKQLQAYAETLLLPTRHAPAVLTDRENDPSTGAVACLRKVRTFMLLLQVCHQLDQALLQQALVGLDGCMCRHLMLQRRLHSGPTHLQVSTESKKGLRRHWNLSANYSGCCVRAQ